MAVLIRIDPTIFFKKAMICLMSYVLAIDQGTQSTRAAVLSQDGRIMASVSVQIESTRPQNNWVEQSAEQIATSVETSINDLFSILPKTIRSSVDCCGIATQRSTVLSWDHLGNILSPALNWQDTRGQEQLRSLVQYKSEIKQISGLPLSAHYGASKLHWLIENINDSSDKRFGPLSSFLLYRVSKTETSAVDHGNAQRMQLLDIATGEWSQRLLELFGVPVSSLPECKPIYHDYGELKEYGISITAMNGDQNAAWFGSGLPVVGTALINIGSGAFILTPQQGVKDLPELLTTIAYSDESSRHQLLEATVNGAGNALKWLSATHGINDYRSELQSSLEQVVEPPIFLNTVGGLGSPWWKSGLAPRFANVTEHYSRPEMIAGVCESILFLIYHNIREIQKIQAISELQISGGLSMANEICQKLATLSNLKVKCLNNPESTLKGIAWIASGKPDDWGVSEYVEYLPKKDPRLSLRFECFLEKLNNYIEGIHYG